MARLLGHLLFVVCCGSPAVALAGAPPPNALFGVQPPLHLIAPGIYEDGGTVPFIVVGADAETLRGGFDGRMRIAEAAYPLHCYVGNVYTTDPGARLLPLWGAEERALVRLLATLLHDSLSADQIRRIEIGARPLAIGEEFGPGIPGLVLCVERRMRTHVALERQLLASVEDACRFFDCTEPLQADSLSLDARSNEFRLRVTESKGAAFNVRFPASTDSLLNPSSASRVGHWQLRFHAGGWEDRMLITITQLALEGTPDKGSPAHAAQPNIDEQNRTSLLALLKARYERILALDATR